MDRSRQWSLTINNPTQEDEEAIALARQKGWKVEGQKEQGKEGTPHQQLMVDCGAQQRFSALKKTFPRAHIEAAKSPAALRKQVQKEDTRIAPLQVSQDQQPSQAKVWDELASYIEKRQKTELGFTDRWAKHKLNVWDEFIRDMIERGQQVELIGINPQVRSAVKWQGDSIIKRSIDRQTDRQTSELRIVVPEYNVDEEHNNADEEDE